MKPYEQKLWRQARRAGLLLQVVPFVRFVAVVGSLGTGDTKPDSDADLMLVTTPEHLYTARGLSLGLLALVGLRAKPDRPSLVDPNYWLTADHLDILPHNAYVARVYTKMVPLWDSGHVFFGLKEANRWVKDYGRKFRIINLARPHLLSRLLQFTLELILWPLSHPLENWARRRQEATVRDFAERQGITEPIITDKEIRVFLKRS